MKKVLTALLTLVASISILGLRTSAAETGNLVVHFQKWDGDYSLVGINSWGDDVMPGQKNPAESGAQTDEFGIYFEFNGLTVSETGSIGFQTVVFDDGANPNWNKKLANVEIPKTQIVAGETRHVYMFEGGVSRETGEENFAYPIYAPIGKESVVVVYFDSTNNYEENLGFHSWDWETNAPGWNDPLKNFEKVGRAADGTFVYAALHVKSGDSFGGLIVYYGNGDDSKKTGNIEVGNTENAAYIESPKAAGEANMVYVINKGDANTSMNNVFLSATTFAEEAFAFKLVGFDPEAMSGTYATSPTVVVVATNQEILNPYAKATTPAEQTAAEAKVKSWFTVKEKTGENTYGPALQVERVDFAKSNSTIKDFVVILSESTPLDISKEYEVFFDLGLPSESLAVAKQVSVTLNVTVPENTPAEAVIRAAGDFATDAWNPEVTTYQATKNGDVYTLTFNVMVQDAFTVIPYKWTRGSWATEEYVAENRSIVIPNNVDSVVFDDVIPIWADSKEETDVKYPAPDRKAGVNLSASIAIDMDTEAPVLTFISPSGILGKPAAERIIEVAWGTPFDQNLFPGYRVVDNRDGDLTPLVFVPKGANSVLDTRTEGDYTIMLQVEDKWGNVTQETFIFRVVKK